MVYGLDEKVTLAEQAEEATEEVVEELPLGARFKMGLGQDITATECERGVDKNQWRGYLGCQL